MHPEGRRKCLHCEKFFLPDPRNRHHQRHCGKRECRKASKQLVLFSSARAASQHLSLFWRLVASN